MPGCLDAPTRLLRRPASAAAAAAAAAAATYSPAPRTIAHPRLDGGTGAPKSTLLFPSAAEGTLAPPAAAATTAAASGLAAGEVVNAPNQATAFAGGTSLSSRAHLPLLSRHHPGTNCCCIARWSHVLLGGIRLRLLQLSAGTRLPHERHLSSQSRPLHQPPPHEPL